MIERYIIALFAIIIIVLLGLIIAYNGKYGTLLKSPEEIKKEEEVQKQAQKQAQASTNAEFEKPIRIVYFANIFMPLLIIIIGFAFYLLFFLPHIHIISSESFKKAVSTRTRNTGLS